MRAIVAIAMMLIVGFSANAHDFEVNGIYCTITSIRLYEVEVDSDMYGSIYSGDIVIPESVTYLGKKYSVTSIGKHVFSYCRGLTSIEISNSVTYIGDCAFIGCSGLTSVNIGKSVTEIGNYAFSGCDNLEEINCMATVPPVTDGSFVRDYSAVLNVPMRCADVYRAAEEWCGFKTINEVDFTGIENVVKGDEISVSVNGNDINITGTEDLSLVEVYDINGVLVYAGTEQIISVPTKGLYLVIVGAKTTKVLVK